MGRISKHAESKASRQQAKKHASKRTYKSKASKPSKAGWSWRLGYDRIETLAFSLVVEKTQKTYKCIIYNPKPGMTSERLWSDFGVSDFGVSDFGVTFERFWNACGSDFGVSGFASVPTSRGAWTAPKEREVSLIA